MRVHDVVGVGIGPFNLALAALLDRVEGVDAVFCERSPEFRWHPGLLMEGTTTQVPFLADAVTLVDPTSPHGFLSYLHERDRLYRFYFRERFHVPRREYDDYCRWVSNRLPSCRFDSPVDAVCWNDAAGAFEVTVRDETLWARNVVLGVGTAPWVPPHLADAVGPDVVHSSAYLPNADHLRSGRAVTVIGSGQSGAEVFLELLRDQPAHGYRLDWLTRSAGFFPMEYTPLGLEHFTPDYLRYFHGLAPAERARLLSTQDLLYKGIDAETLGEIYGLLYERTVGQAELPVRLLAASDVLAIRPAEGGLVLDCRHREQDRTFGHAADRVVLATGYRAGPPAVLEPMRDRVAWDTDGRLRIDLDYRVALDPSVGGTVYVQNAELHTHGVGTPDLGLGAHRAATIANALAGRTVYRLPGRTTFTDFGVELP